ncbi:hypothetical protein [Leisingera sp.]|uniref:hypothetical protein n=1 Tax=Leisingera sp. TaxID=1879318 RepID=UPI003A9091F0
MSAHTDMTAALTALTDRLRELNDLVTANHFMVEAMASQQDQLKQMSVTETRAFLRRQAREKFHPETGDAPNPAALAVLEEVLSPNQQSAEIIAFPKERQRRIGA